jgi:hypothetical protein
MLPRTNRSATTAALAIAAAILVATPAAMGQGYLVAVDSNRGLHDLNRFTGETVLNWGPLNDIGTPGDMAFDPYLATMYASSTSLNSLFLAYWGELIGPFGDPSIDMTGLAWNANNDTLYGASLGGLYTIDTETGAATLVGNTGIPGESNLTFDPSRSVMYLTSSDTDSLYSLDLVTAAATFIGPLNGPTNSRGVAYVPDDDAIYLMCSDTQMLYSVDRSTGAATAIGSIEPAEIVGLVWEANGFADCSPFFPDYDNDGGVTGADIGAFFADYEIGAPCADVDRDGGVTGADLAWFFVCFEQC